MYKVFRMLAGAVMACSAICTEAAETPASFDLQGQPLNAVVALYYKEVVKRPYVMCNDVLQDTRLVSIRASGKMLDAAMVSQLLDTYGFEAREEKGVVLVCNKPKASEAQEYDPMIYRVQHRDAAYLVDLLSPLVRGTFANKRAASQSLSVGGAQSSPTGSTSMASSVPAPPMSALSMKPGIGDDYIIFTGPEKERAKLTRLLAQLDVATGEVMVKGYLYEVGKNETDGSALNMVLSLLKGKLSLSVAGEALGNALKIKTGSLDFVASALSADSRFKIVTSPFTRVRSGATAMLQVGQDVPVLGSIVTNVNGQAQQSVDYRQSGVIIEVTPRVRDGSTDLDLTQTVSDFVQTETGLSATPTLNKREIHTSLSVEDGEVLVIGGLNQSKYEMAKSGLKWLPFSLSKAKGERSSELVLILELRKI